MGTLGAWNMFAILCQTIACVILAWLILGCRLEPESTELHEVTLMKLLYLYDPKACERIHFYNYMVKTKNNDKTERNDRDFDAAIVWPEENEIAAGFRKKIKLWVSLHIMWSFLGVVNISRGNKPCDFYIILIPFTIVGISLLLTDIAFVCLFLIDAKLTSTELDILHYVDSNKNYVRSVNSTIQRIELVDNSSWIGVVMAYCSFRFIVLWILNFWIVKDTYFEGLAVYHKSQYPNYTAKRQNNRRESHMNV